MRRILAVALLAAVALAATGVFLAELSRAIPAGTHAGLVLDGAGWHVSEGLTVPANLTLIHPPPYSPELNPVERVWEYLRDRWLSHRVLAGGYDAVVDAACAAWNALLAEPGRLRSLTNFPWLPPAHGEERLPARLLGAEPLPERGLAQALHRAPQPVRRCHPPPPPVPKPAETLARRRMRVRRNQEMQSCA